MAKRNAKAKPVPVSAGKKTALQRWVGILITACIPVIFFGLIEVGSRLILLAACDGNPDTYDLGRIQISGQTGYFYDKPDQHQIFTEYGFKKSRFTHFHVERWHDHEYRTLVLGGSAVAGSEVNVGGDWSTFTEQLLRQHNADLDISLVNGGIWGGTSAFERMQTFNTRHYGFDLLVIYSGWNDLYSYSMKQSRYLKDMAQTRRRLSELGKFWFELRAHSVALGWIASLYDQQHPLNMGTGADRFDQKIPCTPENRQRFIKEYLGQLQDTLAMAHQQKIPVIFILQSSATYTRQYRPLSPIEESQIDTYISPYKDYWSQLMSYYYPALGQAIKTECQKYPTVKFYDFAEFSHHYQRLYYDDVHYSTPGMYVIGWKVAALIQETIFHRSSKDWVEITPDNYEAIANNRGRPLAR